MKTIYVISLLLSTATAIAQVGINTTTPTADLEVVGDVQIDNYLYLENPGDSQQIRGSKLLIALQNDNLVQYDINQSKYGPINYAEFIFRDLSKDGLQDYDTKISIDDYVLTVQGYYFLEAGSNDTDVMLYSTVDSDNIEGHQVYAYKNTTTNTWFLRAFVNNAEFRSYVASAGQFVGIEVDMYLNLIIYRKGFISKELTPVSIDMGNLETGVAPLPTGF